VGLTSAVQIGNPIEEKKLTEAILRARDKGLFSAITDCGAGGISSAITELAQSQGAEVYLDKVPLKYRGLSYTEIWISESQERMVFFAKEEHLGEIEEIFREEDVEFSVVGKVKDDKRLVLFYKDNKVCDLDMDFIFNLVPATKKAVWINKKEKQHTLEEKDSYNQDLLRMLSAPGIASKDWILREYDHEVQAGSVIKTLAGIETICVNDAAVVRPDLESRKCVAIGLGINPFYSDIDPYWMAALAIDEALRNVISCGAGLDKTFILDNFSWGSPDEPASLGGLVRAARACYDFASALGVPFISGKDSLYNEYMVGKKHISIPGTLLISALSVIDDWKKTLTGNFKKADNLIYIVGSTRPELGASEYFRSLNISAGFVPKVEIKEAKRTFTLISKVITQGFVRSCHDLSEAGLGVCIAEMCMGSDLGASLFLNEVPGPSGMKDYEILFSESPTRFILEVAKKDKDAFEACFSGIPLGLIGCISQDKRMVVYGRDSREVINLELNQLREAWMRTFEEFR
jgi:phosphoribosylformylglycinamidine synthase